MTQLRFPWAACWLAAILALSASAQVLPLNFATSEDPTKPRVIHGFDRNAMDLSVKPCDNFFQYACGTWLKQNPIPADQSAWSRFNELFENNRLVLRGILEKAREAPRTASAETRQVGDYYAACMNEDRANALGAGPLQPLMAEVSALKEKAEFASFVSRMQRRGFGMMFNFGSGQDFQNAAEQIAVLDQGGLGLPDRDYYLKDEERFQKIRAAYQVHLKKMFALAGDGEETAARNAETVMAIEKSMAEVSMDRVARRDTRNLDHRMSIADAARLMPNFDFTAYLSGAGAPRTGDVNVYVPAFFQGLNAQIAGTSLDDWKTYFRWHILNNAAGMLSDAFVNENFDFYGRTLQGRKELPERWKRCVAATDGSLGEALGKIYVEETYGKEGGARMAEMVKNLELALRQACCIDDVLRLRLQPGIGRLRVSTAAPVRAHWPAAWLAGLGAPFNTLRLGGGLQLQAEDLSVEDVQGRLRVSGQAELRLQDLSSRLGPLPTLGSYRLVLSGAADGDEGARVALQTLQGPLRLSGQGQWSGARLRFRGQAQAEPGSEAMLNNLLNLLGQRQGPLALLAIG